jgi:hypothetical protein
MSFNGQLLATGGVAQCLTDSVQVFGADGAYSSNIAVYQFNGNANDATTNYNATTQGSPSYVTGKFGQAASLSNSDTDYFTTSISPTILGNSFSLSAWVYFTQNSGGSDYYSIAGAYWNGSSGNQSWIFYVNNGTLSFFSNLTSGSITVTGGTVPLNQWNFVAFSIDDKNQISLNLNGAITTSAVSLSLRSNSINLTLGNLGPYNAGRTMYGLLDQVRVFNRALSASELNVLYNETDSTTSNTNLFNEGAGIALYTLDYDASDAGGLYNGTPSNVLFGVEGQINTAARFNGSSSAINDVLSGFTYDNKNITFSAWINSTETGTGGNVIIAQGLSNADGGWAISTGYAGAQKLGFSIAKPGVQSVVGSVTMNTGNWQHIVVVVDFADIGSGGTSAVKMYVDGVEDTSLTGNLTQNFDESSYNTSIGVSFAGSNARFFDGDIDQVRIFSKALNQTEIDTLYAENPCNYTCTTDTTNYPTTNLAYYKLDNSADDETGVYDGTSTDVTYTFGRFNQAAVFNGSSSLITVPTLSGFTNYNFTMSFWFNSTSTATSYFMDFRNPIYMEFGYDVGSGAYNNTYSFIIYTGSQYAVHSSANLRDGNWHHIAVTYDGATLKMYIDNGVPITSTINDNTQYAGTGNVIGGAVGGSSIMNGSIDQVRIFSSALSDSQVTELYNEKPCADTSNFKAVLYDGNSNSAGQYVSSVGFQPDLTWIKYTNASIRHLLTDSITGPSVYQGAGITTHSNETFVSNTYGEFTSFDANGFIVQYWSGSQYFNTTGKNYVAWNWKGGGDAVSNSNGSVASTVSANPSSGFSIVKWNGDGTTSQTVGHGLSSAPEIVIMKSLSSSAWYVLTTVISGTNPAYLRLDSTDIANSGTFTSTSTTFTNFAYGGDTIAYCWHSVAGYSKIGIYTGNGTTSKTVSDPSFEPSFVMIKRTDSTSNWRIYDSARGTNVELYANSSSQDVSATGYINFNSNGFEITTTGGWLNANGGTYLYMAFK